MSHYPDFVRDAQELNIIGHQWLIDESIQHGNSNCPDRVYVVDVSCPSPTRASPRIRQIATMQPSGSR